MLVSSKAEVKWNAKIKKHYVERGYVFTKMGDSFMADIADLTSGSLAIVTVRCDYCCKEYNIPYIRYLQGNKDTVEKDCCNCCKKNKIADVLLKKYGVSVPSKVDGAYEKSKATNIERYGAENPFASELVKKKIRETLIEKYGTASPNSLPETQKKRRQTCLSRYGVDSHMKSEQYRILVTGENSPRWKTDKDLESRKRDRSSDEYRRWRNDVFGRDHYRCIRCGSRGDRKHGVEAHHIRNYDFNNNISFDPENGATLCYDCHKKFHSMYGKRNNNLQQLIEFVGHGEKVR